VGRVRFVDGSHIKLHQFGTNPAGGQSAQAIGRTKGGLNTKLCALVEGKGRLVAAVVSPGQTYEVEAVSPLLNNLRNVLLVGDKGFDADALRQQMLAQGCLASIPPSRGEFHRLGITRAFIASGTKSKISSSGLKSTNVSPPAMKNLPWPSSTSSSWLQSSTGSNHFEKTPKYQNRNSSMLDQGDKWKSIKKSVTENAERHGLWFEIYPT
jgi:hypothetical protein